MGGINKKYVCCFCIETIKDKKLTSLIVIANYNKPHSEQNEQQLFCHLSCLKSKMDKDIPLYLLDLEE